MTNLAWMSKEVYMKRAIQLAENGRRRVSPNPLVGCVIVHEGKIIGEGFHAKYGENHAEVNAINSVKDPALLPESEVYITLEPCTHYGNTPPCVDLLISKRVKEVYIGSTDPNPKVDGRGITKLYDAGISVESGIMKDETDRLNARFMTFYRKKRPYIILKWAQTADGYMARTNYDSKWISNMYSRQMVHKLRSEEDAVLVGFNTVKYDNPQLTVRDWKGRQPKRIVLDEKLELNKDLNIYDNEVATFIINGIKTQKTGSVNYMKADFKNLLTNLTSRCVKAHIQSILVEGGAHTLGLFIKEGLWDEAFVFESSSRFGTGLRAPELITTAEHTHDIIGDRLSHYVNETEKE